MGSRTLDKLPTNLVNWLCCLLAMLLNLVNFGSFCWIYMNWVLANLGNFDSIWVILGQFSWIRIILLRFDQLGSCNYNKGCYILLTAFSLFCMTWSILPILNHFAQYWGILLHNNKKRSHTQLDSRKQVIAFQDRVITINVKEAQHPLKWEKQVIDKSSIMLKISTKSMHRVLVWEIGPANNTTRCSRLSKRRLLHAWHPSQLAINLSIHKSKWQIHVNNKSD